MRADGVSDDEVEMGCVTDTGTQIRQVLRDHAHLRDDALVLSDEDNLFDAGMSSHASVSVLIALEETFQVEFPDALLTRSVFESVANLRAAIEELVPATP